MKISGGTSIRRQVARDAELERVIEEFGPRVLGVARRVLRDEARAEEVAQDTFLAYWKDPAAFVPARGTLGVWLCSVARNKAIDAVRREERNTRNLVNLAAVREDGPEGPDADTARAVRDAVAGLTYVQKEALFLAYFEGLTYREVAVRLGVPEGTAKTRLRDALNRLRRVLQPLSLA